MINSLPQISPEKYLIEIVDGPDRGAKFQVLSGQIKIGRGEENDIVLNDPRCSREHAVITISPQAIFIEDLNSQNGITVDGQKSPRSFLTNGSRVSLGSTTLVFKKMIPEGPSLSVVGNNIDGSSTENILASKQKKKNKIIFYAIIVGVALIAVLLITENQNKNDLKNKAFSVDDEIDNSKKRQEALFKEQLASGKASRQYLDAQASFTKGLRDYREGLFKSAVSAFSATLSIYPEHEAARRYLRLAQLKLDEQVQLTVQEGNRYMDQGLYQNAKASFNQVMILVGDPENKIYQEAREKYNECVLILRGAF